MKPGKQDRWLKQALDEIDPRALEYTGQIAREMVLAAASSTDTDTFIQKKRNFAGAIALLGGLIPLEQDEYLERPIWRPKGHSPRLFDVLYDIHLEQATQEITVPNRILRRMHASDTNWLQMHRIAGSSLRDAETHEPVTAKILPEEDNLTVLEAIAEGKIDIKV